MEFGTDLQKFSNSFQNPKKYGLFNGFGIYSQIYPKSMIVYGNMDFGIENVLLYHLNLNINITILDKAYTVI